MKAEVKIEWEKIDKHGDKIEMKDFKARVKDRAFIDYDGFGYLSDGKKVSDLVVIPSIFIKGKVLVGGLFVKPHNKIKIPKWATCVIWFNR